MVLDTLEVAPDMRLLATSADPICDFYTSHPYPPPVANLDRAQDEWRDPNRHRAEYHLLWPDRPYRADLDILVAGCGTWQAAKYALCRPDARVVGIDISPTSLDCTEQLKRQYGLTNLETRQLAIEEAEALEQRFDLVVCTGVLHHLVEPDAGLRALRRVLRPRGALYVMVYATYGRSGISMLREYCQRLGVGTNEPEIVDLVDALAMLPAHHPAVSALRGARDARDPHALADALLNPRERSYSVPQLLAFLERGDFAFGRWHLQAPYSPGCGAIAGTSHATRLAALPRREQYAAMELWRGTILSHSVIAYPSDGSLEADVVLEQGWKDCVPFRLPHTLCIEERLPPGAAAVLLNRSHAHPDLILPIDRHEKRMFDAIDGRRSIGDIIQCARGSGEWPPARGFFQKLWCHDQVVFDASKGRS